MFHPSLHHHNQNQNKLSKQQRRYTGSGRGGGGAYCLGGTGGSCFCSCSEGGYDWSQEGGFCLGQPDLVFSPIKMAEDDSKDNVVMIQDQENNKDGNNNNNCNEDWLQLSIGGSSRTQEKQDHPQNGELVELNLLPRSSSNNSSSQEGERLLYSSLFLQNQVGISSSNCILPPPLQSQINQETNNLVYRPMTLLPRPPPLGLGSSSSSPSPSSSSFIIRPPGAYFSSARTPFQLFQTGPAGSRPRQEINFRVVNPPRRPHSGIWFMLQASQNQAKEPFLPQIPNSYLRIKDGRMTIRLVMKYLANKLKLEHESQVEVTCRGQQLLPLLTLQHVRDNIWNHNRARNSFVIEPSRSEFSYTPRTALSRNNNNNIVTLVPDSECSITHHIMLLHYARSSI